MKMIYSYTNSRLSALLEEIQKIYSITLPLFGSENRILLSILVVKICIYKKCSRNCHIYVFVINGIQIFIESSYEKLRI